MLHIVYETENGEINRLTPAPGARLVSAIDGVTFTGQWTLELALAALGHGRSWSAEKIAGLGIGYAETEEEFCRRIAAKDVPLSARWTRMIEESELPDRRFRGAWGKDALGENISIDMPKAREIHMARIRKARDDHPNWKQIDRDRAIATEGTDIAGLQDVKRRADRLRNLPDSIAPVVGAALTPEDLDAIWPEPLPPR